MPTRKMGRLAIGFEGSGPIANEIDAELREGLPAADAAEPDVEFRFLPELPAMPFRRNGSALIGSDRIRVQRGGYLYEPAMRDGRVGVKLAASPADGNKMKGLRGAARRFRDWNYLDQNQSVAKNFMYDIFDWTTQLAQLQLGQSFMHASSMTSGDRGMAVVGWGGVGKTTSLLKLVIENGWKFLSDDLGIIDDAGNITRAPKRLQVYGYNVEGQAALRERVLQERTVLDQLSWSYMLRRRGGKGVRRRISPQDLFGDAGLGTGAKLTDLIYLERTDGDRPTLHDIDSEEVARRMSAIVMAEIEPYGAICREAEAGGASFMRHPAEVQEQTRQVLGKAFSSARTRLVRVGKNADPNSLTELILSQF